MAGLRRAPRALPTLGAIAAVLAPTAVLATPATAAAPYVAERVYVETAVDSDGNGRKDRVAIDINRPASGKAPAVLEHTPYKNGLNQVPNHGVDMAKLPQETAFRDGVVPDGPTRIRKSNLNGFLFDELLADGYATISGQSIGTAGSQGCPTSGDMQEAMGAVAVVDWLNGRAKGYSSATGSGEVTADWATGKVGMTGVSYNGTLPNMAAATGVEGLAAIVPIAAITDWYDYYRANGLVVAPGGYQGEDADVLAKAVVGKTQNCSAQIAKLAREQGREHGDYTRFWKDRDFSDKVENVRAAVLIGHGMGDWNVKGTHYAKWYEALAKAGKNRKIVLHRGGHANPNHPQWRTMVTRWWDRWLKGVDNGIDREPRADVDVDGTWMKFADWPDPAARHITYRLGARDATSPGTLTVEPSTGTTAQTFTDVGKSAKVATLIADGLKAKDGRLVYLTEPMSGAKRLSGRVKVNLQVAVENKTAANLTVALARYDSGGRATHITRGWADPQNAASLAHGTPLTPGKAVTMSFYLEPQDRAVPAGERLGLVVLSTDSDYTLRINGGTKLRVEPAGSSVELLLADR